MRLTITNKTPSSISVGGRVGRIRGAGVNSFDLTIAELEGLRVKLVALADAGVIEWVTANDSGNDSAEGATVSLASASLTEAEVYADQRVAQPDSSPQGAGHAFAAADIGNVVFATGAGAQAFTLPDLSGSLIAGRALILTVQCTGNATAVTITPGAGSQIDNAGVGVAFVAAVGRTRISLMSRDGLNWYSGA